MKRGKEDRRYHPRKFVLCEADDTLKYHVKEVCLIYSLMVLVSYMRLHCIELQDHW